jgi:hypothetical protein
MGAGRLPTRVASRTVGHALRDVTYLDAWSVWFSGASTENLRMYGIEMRTWGRIGKLLQFIGAATVIVEIVGAERLQAIGASLHASTPLERRIRNVGSRAGSALREAGLIVFVFIWVVSSLLLVVALVAVGGYAAIIGLLGRDQAELSVPIWLPIVFLMAAPPAVLLVVHAGYGLLLVLLRAAAAVGLVVDAGAVRPVAWALDRPALERLAKILGFLLIIVGFQFDLLVS